MSAMEKTPNAPAEAEEEGVRWRSQLLTRSSSASTKSTT